MRLKVFAIVFIGIISCSIYFNQDQKGNIYETESRIEVRESPWKVDAFNIGQDKNIKTLFVFDEDSVIGGKFERNAFILFRTNNTGNSWQELITMTEFRLINILFLNSNEGLMVLTRRDNADESMKRVRFIFKTEDGGFNWKQVYFSDNAAFASIKFNEEGIGIITGFQDTFNNKYEYKNLLLLTKDKGQTWIDISDNLNSLLENKLNKRPETLNNIVFSETKTILGFSSSGKIYQSINHGKSWELVSKVSDNSPIISSDNFGKLEDGKFWFSESLNSIEGTFGTISKAGDNGVWDKYKLSDYFFSDVTFLNTNEILASGVKFTNQQKKGVILHSVNSGKNWSIIYESQITDRFNYISRLTEQKFYIVGNNGESVILERIIK